MMTLTEARREGDLRKQAGMSLTGVRKGRFIRLAQLALLNTGLGRADQTCSADDIPDDLDAKYAEGGKWVGPAVSELARRGLLEKAGYAASLRPSRHYGDVKLWRITDTAKTAAYIWRLRDWLSRPPPLESIPENLLDII